jgi:hypothetical protein
MSFAERLKNVRTIVTHEGCPDGIASAILCHDALPQAEIVWLQYGTAKRRELLATEGMLFVDMTPEPSRNQEFVDAGAIALDHHRGAAEQVAAFGELGVFADEKAEPGVSGAVLAYRHVWLPMHVGARRGFAEGEIAKRASDFAYLAGVRDTWQTKDPHWAASCAQAEALRFWPVDTCLMADPFGCDHEPHRRLIQIGPILVAKKAEAVTRALERAWRTTTAKGTRLVVFEGTSLTSDAAEALGDTADLVIGFGYEVEDGQAKLILSSRSHTTFDCSALAKRFGGGGHTAAAGFSTTFGFAYTGGNNAEEVAAQNPYVAARDFVEWFEQ